MPTRAQNVCCQEHAAASEKILTGDSCITMNPGVEQLLQEAPLEMSRNQHLVYYDDKYVLTGEPVEQGLRQRFFGYQNLVFWLYPGLRRNEKHPLPACTYHYVHLKFPNTDNK
ncbi:uncharacterized protein [Watersipora subatra]|uniref:uncharacterized protein n=1 Tax=Watersipora subatra TaxID=2589382 RepID=UPI00355BA026